MSDSKNIKPKYTSHTFEYIIVFIALTLLTGLELAIPKIPFFNSCCF